MFMSISSINSTSTSSLYNSSSSSSSSSALEAKGAKIKLEIAKLQKEGAAKNAEKIKSLNAQLTEIETEIADANSSSRNTAYWHIEVWGIPII